MNATCQAPRGQKTPPPGARPGVLSEPGQQRSDHTVRRSSGEADLTLGLHELAEASGESVDASALGWLTVRALNEQRWAEDEEGRQRLRARAAHTSVVVQKPTRSGLSGWRRGRGRKSSPKASSSRPHPACALRTWKPGHHSPRERQHVRAPVLAACGLPGFLRVPGPRILRSILQPLLFVPLVSCVAGGVQDLDSSGDDFGKMLVFFGCRFDSGYTRCVSPRVFYRICHIFHTKTDSSECPLHLAVTSVCASPEVYRNKGFFGRAVFCILLLGLTADTYPASVLAAMEDFSLFSM